MPLPKNPLHTPVRMLPRESFGPNELLLWLEWTQQRNERARLSHQRRRHRLRRNTSGTPP